MGVLSVLCVGVCVCEWGQSCHSMFPGVRGQFSGLNFYLVKTESQISGCFCCTLDTRLAKLQAWDQFSFLCLPSQDGNARLQIWTASSGFLCGLLGLTTGCQVVRQFYLPAISSAPCPLWEHTLSPAIERHYGKDQIFVSVLLLRIGP